MVELVLHWKNFQNVHCGIAQANILSVPLSVVAPSSRPADLDSTGHILSRQFTLRDVYGRNEEVDRWVVKSISNQKTQAPLVCASTVSQSVTVTRIISFSLANAYSVFRTQFCKPQGIFQLMTLEGGKGREEIGKVIGEKAFSGLRDIVRSRIM